MSSKPQESEQERINRLQQELEETQKFNSDEAVKSRRQMPLSDEKEIMDMIAKKAAERRMRATQPAMDQSVEAPNPGTYSAPVIEAPQKPSAKAEKDDDWLEAQFKSGLQQPTEQLQQVQAPTRASATEKSGEIKTTRAPMYLDYDPQVFQRASQNNAEAADMYLDYDPQVFQRAPQNNAEAADIVRRLIKNSEVHHCVSDDHANYISTKQGLEFKCVAHIGEHGIEDFAIDDISHIKSGIIIVPNPTTSEGKVDIIVIENGKVIKFVSDNGGLDSKTAEKFKKEAKENTSFYDEAVKKSEASVTPPYQTMPEPQTIAEKAAEVFTSAKDVLMEAVRSIVEKMEAFTTPEHHKRLKAKMEEEVSQGKLEKATPKISQEELPANAERVTEYGEGKASLKKTQWKDGTYSFEAGQEFTGVIKMPRKGADGKLLESFDWVQFVDGKVVKDGVIEGLEGESIIKNISDFKIKAGIEVAPQVATPIPPSVTIDLPPAQPIITPAATKVETPPATPSFAGVRVVSNKRGL